MILSLITFFGKPDPRPPWQSKSLRISATQFWALIWSYRLYSTTQSWSQSFCEVFNQNYHRINSIRFRIDSRSFLEECEELISIFFTAFPARRFAEQRIGFLPRSHSARAMRFRFKNAWMKAFCARSYLPEQYSMRPARATSDPPEDSQIFRGVSILMLSFHTNCTIGNIRRTSARSLRL